MKLCDYGCGREGKYQLKNGKWCCESYWQSCPTKRKENSEANKGSKNGMFGKTHSEETINKIKENTTGNKNHFYRKKHTKETKLIMSENKKGKYAGEKHPMYGKVGYWKGKVGPQKNKRKSDQCKLKHSIKVSGQNNPNWKGGIAYEPYCDIWLDEEYKQSIRDRDRNRCLNPDCWGNCNHLPLDIHHINYIKKDCKPKNLITICRSCNTRANKDREWHQVWYEAIIYRRYRNKGVL